MAPIIWGLNLGEIQWSKFKSSYMWNNDYHLRRTKFIVYQCALIFCVFSESLGTDALSNYLDSQDHLARLDPNAKEHNNDYVGIASYNIWAGVFTATIFGAAFFFDLFWPERHESRSVRWAWKICSLVCIAFILGDVIAYTIIVANHSAHVTGVSPARATELMNIVGGHTPRLYRLNGRVVASLVFIWLGFLSVIGSTILLWISDDYNDRYGVFSSTARAAGKGTMEDAEVGSKRNGAYDVNGMGNGTDGVGRPMDGSYEQNAADREVTQEYGSHGGRRTLLQDPERTYSGT